MLKPKGVINVTVMGLQVIHFIMITFPSRGVSYTFYFGRIEAYHEYKYCDPKDGELYLIRSKSGETLMEDRSSSDVQIDCQNWV